MSLVTHDVTVQIPSDQNQEYLESRQLNPLPLGQKYAPTPPDISDSDTSALDNESQELEGPCYDPLPCRKVMKYINDNRQIDMGQRKYLFLTFPKNRQVT